jgi:hypothetical protein
MSYTLPKLYSARLPAILNQAFRVSSQTLKVNVVIFLAP